MANPAAPPTRKKGRGTLPLLGGAPARAAVAEAVRPRVRTRASGTAPSPSDFVGRASRPIRGVVRDKETGKPLAGVSVEYYAGQGPSALTDKEGRYELLGLAKAREYALNVKPSDGRIGQPGAFIETDLTRLHGNAIRPACPYEQGGRGPRAT